MGGRHILHQGMSNLSNKSGSRNNSTSKMVKAAPRFSRAQKTYLREKSSNIS
jgi:hypothetical protein